MLLLRTVVLLSAGAFLSSLMGLLTALFSSIRKRERYEMKSSMLFFSLLFPDLSIFSPGFSSETLYTTY